MISMVTRAAVIPSVVKVIEAEGPATRVFKAPAKRAKRGYEIKTQD